MYVIVERYYKVNRVVLKALGLWPSQQSYFTQILQILYASILLTFILVQLLVFITRQYNTDLLFKILSCVCPCLFATIKYFLFIIETKNFKKLLEQIQDDWNSLKDKFEINIIEGYACKMKFYTTSSVASCYIGILLLGILQHLPLILDIMLPLNESRPYQLIVITEYFVNQDKYIHVMMLHEFLVIFVGSFIIIGTGSILVIYIIHICALLKIASYRIENAIEKNILEIPSPTREYLLHRKIVHAIVIHRRAIEFNEFLTSICLLPFATLIVVGVSSLTFNLFLFIHLITANKNIMACVTATSIIFHLIYLFVANYCGQAVINHAINWFEAIYNGLWYAAPSSTQKLILFIMQRGRIYLTISCYSVFVASLEGFATLTSTAVSYFTVIYSTQK
ncbi:uncharacterized protein LOC105197962 [Solenopsis invicta]|uniref:uncharacterized protein LOC105197962 n=1 Tax=Solenopsis invicta TaxID=13686 RepID=UPI00193D2F09|nr:uncharacterized protein LOC105197962 [Solenopsis invicta]